MSKLADDLERLCCAETEGKFFDCVTDNATEIIRALRSLEQIKKLVAGDRVPNWKDDWQTTHTRGLILDIIDGAIVMPSGDRGCAERGRIDTDSVGTKASGGE